MNREKKRALTVARSRRGILAILGATLWVACSMDPVDDGTSLALQRTGPAPDGEKTGQASSALNILSQEENVNTVATLSDTRSPSVAWIRTPTTGFTQDPGAGLIAFSRNDGGSERVAWSFSGDWNEANPTWTTAKADDADPSVRWPAPDNLCESIPDAFECDGTGDGWNGFAMGSVQQGRFNHAANALWTGLDNVGAVVATGGYGVNDQHVLIATTADAGQTFKHSLLLSIPDEDGSVTGGEIDPASVHASLGAFGEVTTPRAGKVALPIYVLWRMGPVGSSRWFWTRVMVGQSGTIAEAMRPRPIDFIPANRGSHASIFGYRKSGVEHVGVAWSERGDANSPIACPSTQTTDVAWFASQTNDFGDNWGCFEGNYEPEGYDPPFGDCSSDKTKFAKEEEWRPCVGLAGGRNSLNNDRPEVAMNMPADVNDSYKEHEGSKRWLFTVNHRDGSDGMRVCLYRTGGPISDFDEHSRFQLVDCSNDTDPEGVAVEDAWGQSIAVMSGAGASGNGDLPLASLLFKESTADKPQGIRMVAMELQGAASYSTSEARVTTDGNDGTNAVPFSLHSDPGLTTGVAMFQKCDSGVDGCPVGGVFNYPEIGVLGAWPDGRVLSPGRTNIFARSWEW